MLSALFTCNVLFLYTSTDWLLCYEHCNCSYLNCSYLNYIW